MLDRPTATSARLEAGNVDVIALSISSAILALLVHLMKHTHMYTFLFGQNKGQSNMDEAEKVA